MFQKPYDDVSSPDRQSAVNCSYLEIRSIGILQLLQIRLWICMAIYM